MPGVASTLETVSSPSSTNGSQNTGIVPPYLRRSTGPQPLVVLPAGIFGDIVGSLAGTIGEVTGGYFGNKELGRTLGETAGPLIKHFSPFEVYAPSVAPQSAGPNASKDDAGPDEPVIVVPAGFLTGLVGGVGGNLLGGLVGGLFGNKKLGSDIGSGVGGALGAAFGPFTLAPPSVAPSSGNGPSGASATEEQMLVVPAGFFGNLIGATAGAIGNLVGGNTGRQIGDIAGGLAQQLLPWSSVPPELAPQSTGPDGSQQSEDLVVVPVSIFSGLLRNYGDLIGCIPTQGWNLPKSPTATNGTQVTGDLLPFHAVPPQLAPQSTGPTTPEDTLMLVPAGLFGSLLSGLGGALGSVVGGAFGDAKTGRAVGDIVGQVGNFLPFSVIPR